MVLATYGFGTAAFSALLLWQAGDPKLGLLTVAGFLGGFALFALIGWAGAEVAAAACAALFDSTRPGASRSPRCSGGPAPPWCRSSRWRWA